MDTSNINYFDLGIVAVLIASGIFAFRRGLVREVMSMGTWVLAGIFAVSFFPMAKPYVEAHIKNQHLAEAVTALGLFCIAIVTLIPLGNYLNGLVKGPTISSIDRSLGFVFGLIRGFVIACIVYWGSSYVWTQDLQPPWLEKARTKPALAYGVELIQSVLPDEPDEAFSKSVHESREAAERAVEEAKRLEDISTPIPVYTKGLDKKASSYGEESREKMNNLIDRNAPQ